MTRLKNGRKRQQKGFVTVEFIAGVVLLLFPTAIMVGTLPTWFERIDMARAASREAAREYVLTGSQAQASAQVDTIAANYGLPNDTMSVTFTGDNPSDANARNNAAVIATIKTTIPAVRFPVFDLQTLDLHVNVSHSEPIDEYRSVQ